ncbi:MAG TPA: class I SAM-dependent methyltransferase [Acidimicrobiales bacterium]|nr:class I SAM-dependent methyltransferase [Acidimicrobiales bacterium]
MTEGGPYLGRVRRFYDDWTPKFLAGFGSTFQAGLLKEAEDGPEDLDINARLLAQRAGIEPGDHVLDAGCGVGGPAMGIASALGGVRVTGITVSGVQAAIGTGLVAEAGLASRVSILQGDYHDLPFGRRSFDGAYLFEATGYSHDRSRLFHEVTRVVRPGGRIYVKDVFAPPPPLSRVQQLDLEAFDRLWCLSRTPSIPDVEQALRSAGCEIITSGPLANVGNSTFLRAMIEFDPGTIFRVNELGKAFALRAHDLPTFFGEVSARVRA